MKNIVLITNEYPYGTGETYVEAELEYAHSVAKITVIPIGANDSDNYRTLPENVKLLSPQSLKSKKNTLLLKTAFSKPFINGLRDLKIHKKLKIKTVIELFKFVYASKVHYSTILNTLNKNGMDNVSNYIFYSYWMDSTSLSISYFKKHGAKAVTRCHGGDLYDERLPWKHQFLRKYLAEHLDYVCPVSVQGKEYLDKRIGVHNNVIPMHLGIMDNGVGSYNNDKIPIIVSCSSVIPLKRIDLIINALSLVKTNYKWIHFGDGADFEKIKQLAKENLNSNNYEFKGSKPNQEIGEFYRDNNVRVFINVSSTEGVPVSIMEALSYGIPVIATNVGGVSEQIQSGFNGELADKNISDQNLAVEIENMLNKNEIEYSELRKNARCSYEENWNYKSNYSKFYSMI